MPHSIVKSFYTAFQNQNAEEMSALYHEDGFFKDPAFGKLNALEAGSMWKMLLERSKGELAVTYTIIEETESAAKCRWEAQYSFGPKKRPIHNKITAYMKFRDGKIIEHIDKFDFWKWSRMALGPSGWFLGFTPIVKNKVNKTVKNLLADYMRENEL